MGTATPASTGSRRTASCSSPGASPGTGPGQFNLPHSVWAHTDGRVFVCDRENDRVQIFSPTGELLPIWTNVTRPGDLFIDADGNIYIGEMGWEKGATQSVRAAAGRGPPGARLTIRDIEGNVLTALGRPGPVRRWQLRLAARALGGLAGQHLRRRGDPDVAEPLQSRWHEGCHSLAEVRPHLSAPHPAPSPARGRGGVSCSLSLWEGEGVRVRSRCYVREHEKERFANDAPEHGNRGASTRGHAVREQWPTRSVTTSRPAWTSSGWPSRMASMRQP